MFSVGTGTGGRWKCGQGNNYYISCVTYYTHDLNVVESDD